LKIFNTGLKLGDKLLCKKSAIWWEPTTESGEENYEFVKGNFYQIQGTSLNGYIEFGGLNFSNGGHMHVVKLWDHFCTLKETRKIKLKKLNQIK